MDLDSNLKKCLENYNEILTDFKKTIKESINLLETFKNKVLGNNQ